ncbi:ABC transporter ATP-binding protein/permease [Acidiphilium sp.]|jgi:ATP-binding cassette subfamily B protein|uniref:ABCB family ABC transporter ATP-binding protein/permease n=1 Tax=Acidiphilium sp. TaxID=527 RepID=UPI0025904D70|nr:ABC transporter ATP-binding protein/permease [Acidiphilium sp.]
MDRPAPSRSSLATIGSLLAWLWPRGDRRGQARMLLALASLIAAKIATVLVPVYYSRAVDLLAPKHGGVMVVPVALIGAYGLARIAASGFGEWRDALFARVQQRTVRRIARETFVHLHRLSLAFHLERQTGGLARAIDRGTRGIEQVLRFAVFNILPTLLEVVMVTVILWRMFNWRFAAVTFLAVLLYIGFTLLFTNWRVRFRRAMNAMDSDAQTKALDSLLNYETVKYFGNEALEAARYDASLAAYERAAVKSQVTLSALNFGQGVIIALGLVAVMLMAAGDVAHAGMSVGRFVLVNTYLIQLYQPLNFLGFVYREIKQGLVDMEQMFRLLAEHETITDRAEARPLAPSPTPAALAFEAVRFGYGPDRTILDDISFSLKPGATLAIVGPTGSGKSTITRLIFRFYEASAGRVSIDGEDIRDLTQESLRAAIGVVPQDTVLFNDTIAYNIAYGRPGASEAEIERAAQLAQIHEFIASLPQGYATRVGERGLKLSGGERQRIAIARTILKNPRLLVLDEATSALDTATERDINAALRQLVETRTTLVIAHRLSTVVEADEIIVLAAGAIAERGTHASLLAKSGLYARLWAVQADQRHPETLGAD